MFNNDLAQKYNLQDATLEILIMLLGALLLGFLLGWLTKKLFSSGEASTNSRNLSTNSLNDYSASNNSFSNHGERQAVISTNKQPHIVKTNNNAEDPTSIRSKSSYSTPRIDDFTKIRGITPRIQSLLKNNGIKSFTDLRDADNQTLITTLDITSHSDLARDAQSWQHQASLAAKGDWKKLDEYQQFIERTSPTNQANEKNNQYTENVRDDLKKIEGIGPKIEDILNSKGINTYKDLRKVDRDTIKAHLIEADDRFKNHEPETWPLQAGMAERGEWEELKIYQEFMDDDTEIFARDDKDGMDESHLYNKEQGNSEKNSLNSVTTKTNITHINRETQDQDDSYSSKDDLKKIDGIGPKIEAILNKNGISTYHELKNTDRNTLKSYLDEAGSQFKMHEPESWPHQASLADKGNWEELEKYQDSLLGARAVSTPLEQRQQDDKKSYQSSSAPSLHVKNVSSSTSSHDKQNDNEHDDLKKIEGIGPKIEELLNKAGITTFKALMECSSTTIKDLLDAAGPQYRMHNPDTWPHQAKMAFKGEWEKLAEYQDFLMGGRE